VAGFSRLGVDMDKFWVVIQAVGDIVVPLLAIVIGFIGLCVLSPSLQDAIHHVEARVRASPIQRRIMAAILVVVILFCALYLIAHVKLALKQARESGPVYEERMMLWDDARSLAKNIRRDASSCDNETNTADCASAFWDSYTYTMWDIKNRLHHKGVDTAHFSDWRHDMKGVNGKGIDADTMRAAATEIDKEADQLLAPNE
jgi:hypothetical protein